MRKAIIACLAIAFLTTPLHAESAGSAALKGGAKGAGQGAADCTTYSNLCRQRDNPRKGIVNNMRAIQPTTTTTKPVTSGSQQQTGRK
jgi:hypothetical protein